MGGPEAPWEHPAEGEGSDPAPCLDPLPTPDCYRDASWWLWEGPTLMLKVGPSQGADAGSSGMAEDWGGRDWEVTWELVLRRTAGDSGGCRDSRGGPFTGTRKVFGKAQSLVRVDLDVRPHLCCLRPSQTGTAMGHRGRLARGSAIGHCPAPRSPVARHGRGLVGDPGPLTWPSGTRAVAPGCQLNRGRAPTQIHVWFC